MRVRIGVHDRDHSREQMAVVPRQVALSLHTEFENFTTFEPSDASATALESLLDQIVAWSTALAPPRATSPAAA